MMKERLSWLRWLLFLGGLALFAAIVHHSGIRTIIEDVASQGWALPPFLVLSAIENAFHAASSRRCIRPQYRGAISGGRSFLLYNMAYAINLVTPTGDVGGDVARGIAMGRYLPAGEAASSVMINKFTYCIARMGIAGGFAGLAVLAFPMTSGLGWMIGMGGGLTLVALLLFAYFQARGLLGKTLTRIARVAGSRSQAWMRLHASELDDALTSFYSQHREDLIASILWDALGSLVGAVQRGIFMVLLLGRAALSTPGFLLAGAAVWGITNLFDMVFFFVVGRLGIREGSYQVAFRAVGLPLSKGVALSIIDRIDQLFWTLLGLGVYWVLLVEKEPVSAGSLAPVERVPK